jgi:hypothetical protein
MTLSEDSGSKFAPRFGGTPRKAAFWACGALFFFSAYPEQLAPRLHTSDRNAGVFQRLPLTPARFHPSEGHLARELAPTLRNHAFLRDLTNSQLTILAPIASAVVFQEGEIIVAEGNRSSWFYLLTSGSVAIELRARRYAICVQALGPGEVFGWSALLDEQDTLFQVRAREHSEALRFHGAELKSLCHQQTELGAEILQRTLQVVAGRVRATELRFAEMCGFRT